MARDQDYYVRIEPWDLESFNRRELYKLKHGTIEMKVTRDELAHLHHLLNAAVELEGGDE